MNKGPATRSMVSAEVFQYSTKRACVTGGDHGEALLEDGPAVNKDAG
jgi:hypothetical protein